MAASQTETASDSVLSSASSKLGMKSEKVTEARKNVIEQHNKQAEANDLEQFMLPNPDDTMHIVSEARMFGAAVVVIAITVLVVNQVLTVDAINNTTGPFTGVINDLETTGASAMGLLVIGLLVVAGRVVMGFMGGGGGGGF